MKVEFEFDRGVVDRVLVPLLPLAFGNWDEERGGVKAPRVNRVEPDMKEIVDTVSTSC